MPERPDPKPCREQDTGLFEITKRDGAARIGRLHTKHGPITTPMLLPVINPNIRTIEPREMWDNYGIEALITNSYVIWKHDDLREKSLEQGIHSVLDFPGAVVTDSGTFQSYIYGDVEVSPQEIVAFQREIGVDVGTMLDVFGRPDMSRQDLESSVEETFARSEISLEEAGDDILLNGPIQGGLHHDLRARSAKLMGNADFGGNSFSIHPIGGIVPLMEQQRYRELIEVLLSSKSELPPNRPIHFFGCGHPMLFPLAIALGVDIFDSAAYAIFARDNRIMTPEGTIKLEGLEEWPFHSRILGDSTPELVRSMEKEERCKILSRHNLDITQAELARCREAIRSGTIWQLAEKRSHCSPQLRDAFVWLQDQLVSPDDGPIGKAVLDLIASCNPLRKGGEEFVEDTEFRPHFLHMQALLANRWRIPGSWWDSSSGAPERLVIIHSAPPPWRASALETAIKFLLEEPKSIIFVETPLGPIPFTLEDLSPWCHLVGPDDMWLPSFEDEELLPFLMDFGVSGTPLVRTPPLELTELPKESISKVREWIDRCSIVDKLTLLCSIHAMDACKMTQEMSIRKSRTDRIVNVFIEEKHSFSPRLTDGGISISNQGAARLNNLHKTNPPDFGQEESDEVFSGTPRVCIVDDAVPFVGLGRNVIHGYVSGADSHIVPGQPCLIVNSEGSLVAHGIALSTSVEMSFFRKGIAVKVREGVMKGKD